MNRPSALSRDHNEEPNFIVKPLGRSAPPLKDSESAGVCRDRSVCTVGEACTGSVKCTDNLMIYAVVQFLRAPSG